MSELTQGGAALIAKERQRQIAVENWTAEHDDSHIKGELVDAARVYACRYMDNPGAVQHPAMWPFSFSWFKLSQDPIRNLVKAGALIAAEIDRLQRSAVEPTAPIQADAQPEAKTK